MIWFFCGDGLVRFSFGGAMVAAIVVLFSWIFLGFVAAWLLCGVLRLVRVFWCGGFVAICVFVL